MGRPGLLTSRQNRFLLKPLTKSRCCTTGAWKFLEIVTLECCKFYITGLVTNFCIRPIVLYSDMQSSLEATIEFRRVDDTRHESWESRFSSPRVYSLSCYTQAAQAYFLNQNLGGMCSTTSSLLLCSYDGSSKSRSLSKSLNFHVL